MAAASPSEQLLAQAKMLYAQGRDAEAEEFFQRVAASGQLVDQAFYGLGLVRMRRGDLDAAQRFLEMSLDYRENVNAVYYLGELAERRGAQADALSYYQTALRLDPRHAGALRKLGVGAAVQPQQQTAPTPIPRPPYPPMSPRSLVGIVRDLQRRTGPAGGVPNVTTTWVFRLEPIDLSSGNRFSPVSVEMFGVDFRGTIQDGDWVEIEEAVARAGGPFRLGHIRNLTTNELVQVREIKSWGRTQWG